MDDSKGTKLQEEKQQEQQIISQTQDHADLSSGSSPAGENAPFVNQGLLRWEQHRSQWLGHKSSDTDSTVKAVAVPIDVDEIIDLVFCMPPGGIVPGSRVAPARESRQFPKPVPLPQMVDILVDLWEAAAD